MAEPRPTMQDAELAIKLYDLRREAVMRESRTAINGKFWPKTFEDVAAVVSRPEDPLNAPFRQVSSYWEMVYGMARHGITHADYLMENNAEGMFLFAKLRPHLERFRKEYSPLAFQNAEWVATQTTEGRRRFEFFSARVQKMLATK